MMKYNRITLMFPGQGSQYPGMGLDLYREYEVVRDIYERANQVLGYDVLSLSRKDVQKSIYSQPAVLTLSYACYKVLEESIREADIEMHVYSSVGHSLGQYTAALALGAIDFEAALELAHSRAVFLTDAGREHPDFGLMAVSGRGRKLNYDYICELCDKFRIHVTLNNTPSQIVMGGPKKSLEEIVKLLRVDNFRTTFLKVEAAFHTPIMKSAADKLRNKLDDYNFRIASKPVICNVSAQAIVDPTLLKMGLYEQMFHTINWRGCIERIARRGADLLIELGPKRVLCNMVRDFYPSIAMLNIEDSESLKNTIKELSFK